jgi:cobalamin biosynthesis Mg chelatase CobN
MIPMCLANCVAHLSVTTSAAATTAATQKAQTSATSSNKSGKNSSASTQPTALEITSTLSDGSGVSSGTKNTNGPLPAFEQASGSTEIGCYSHGGFFSNATRQTENHQSASNEVSVSYGVITAVIWVHCRFLLLNQLCIIIRTNFKLLTSLQGSTTIEIQLE